MRTSPITRLTLRWLDSADDAVASATARELVDHLGVAGNTQDQINYWVSYAPEMSAGPGETLAEVIEGADVFLGLSAPGVLTAEMLTQMATRPLILALANPTPEVMPGVARKARPDAIICTGRSDYPNWKNTLEKNILNLNCR